MKKLMQRAAAIDSTACGLARSKRFAGLLASILRPTGYGLRLYIDASLMKNEVILGVSGGEGTENCYFFAKKC